MKDTLQIELDPVNIYRAIDGDVLVESQYNNRGWNSYIAGAPIDSFRYKRKENRDGFKDFNDWLKSFYSLYSDKEHIMFGYIGYDMSKEIEDIENQTLRDYELPDIAFNVYDTYLEVTDKEVLITAPSHRYQNETPENRIENLKDKIKKYEFEDKYGKIETSDISSNFTCKEYKKAVKKVKKYIQDGDTFQVNISQRLKFKSSTDPLDIYVKLRNTNPAPYMGILDYNDYSIISSSPELLIKKQGKTLISRPIAGTRPRGKTKKQEKKFRSELKNSKKEMAEHSILVDLIRNDLGKISKYGSIEVKSFAEVEKYSEVQHLESLISGKKRDKVDTVDIIKSIFPGGTVTGAPKPRTLQIIEEIEPTERGPYTGAMGFIKPNGDFILNILIRSIFRDLDKFYIQVGGGIVHDSNPKNEYEETLNKAKGMLNAL